MRGFLHHVESKKGVYSFVFSTSSEMGQRPQNSNTIVLDLTKPESLLTYMGHNIPFTDKLNYRTTDYFDTHANDFDRLFARGIFNAFDRIIELYREGHMADSYTLDNTEYIVPMATAEYMSTCFKWIEQFLKILFTISEEDLRANFNRRNIKTYSSFGINIHTVRKRALNFEMITTSPADILKDLSLYTRYSQAHPSWNYYEVEEVYLAYKELSATIALEKHLPIFSSLPSDMSKKMINELSDDSNKITVTDLNKNFTDVHWNTLNKILKEILPMIKSEVLGNDFLKVGMGLFKACVILNQPLDSGTIFRQIPIVGKAYQQCLLAKNEELIKECDEYFKKLQTESINLSFEDENFKTIVPVSYKELVDMGNLMHNCLADHEWKNVLTKGARRVVFIQSKKSKDKKYIACDIDIKDGEIQQFLTHNNNSVRNEDFPGIGTFKKRFQEFVYNQYFLNQDFEQFSREKAFKIAKILNEKCSDNYIDTLINIDLKDFFKD